MADANPETQKRKRKIVIIGGGFGGLKAARSLKNVDAEVTVIDKTNHHLFQPLLYQVATAGLAPSNIAFPIRSLFRGHKNVKVEMAEVTDVDSLKNEVITTEGNFPFDYLILAPGSQYNYFGHDEWEKVAPNLKTIPNALEIRERVLMAFEKAEAEPNEYIKEEWLTFVLVGAGPTGVEMAGAVAELAHRALAKDFRHIRPQSARILLVDAVPRILNAFPENLAAKAQARLKKIGVEVMTNSPVKEVTAEEVKLGDKVIRARTVLWTAGVKAGPAGKWLGADVDKMGRVLVRPDCSVPNHPNIFVIGDSAGLNGKDGKPLPGVAPVAIQQGSYVAKLLAARVAGKVFSKPFSYLNKGNLATVGRSAGIAHIGKVQLFGFFAWILWLVVHIFYLVGFKNRVLVFLEWTWNYVTFQRGARLITAPKKQKE